MRSSKLSLAGAARIRSWQNASSDAARRSQRRSVAQLAPAVLTPERMFAAAAALYLLLCGFAFLGVKPETQLYFADYWEHRAILAEVVRGGMRFLDPIYGEAAMSRQFTPWSLALGLAARVTGAHIDTVMAWSAMFVSLLFVIGVQRFARVFFEQAWAPLVLLVCLTCAWGVPALMWTGFYSLRSQLHGNYYPAALVFSLSFVVWAGVLRLLRAERLSLSGACALMVQIAAAVIIHPLNACFLVAGAGAFVAFEPGVSRARRIGAWSLIAGGVGATVFWPYFNPLSLAGAGLARGQPTFNNFSFFFDPGFVISLCWPGIFALVGLPGLIGDKRLRVPLIALGATTAGYVLGGLADVSVSHRLLAYILLWLHLLLTKTVLLAIDGCPPRLVDNLSKRAWRVIVAVAAVLVASQVAAAVQQLTSPWENAHSNYPLHPVEAEANLAAAALPGDARVLGWDSAALVMPAHGRLVVAFPRPMPLSPSDPARQADYRRFFSLRSSTCQRLAIARRWHATHVAFLTFELDPRVARQLAALGPVVSQVEPWRLIKLPPLTEAGCGA